ncbi:MAG: hopanoid biosynthesis-associated protein HpnK [Candidatus Binatus sp.]
MKRLIVNGDDFGLSPEVNAGIMRARRDGILRSASLMVAEPAARAAAELARDDPGFDVGLHAVVCRGRSVLDASRLGAAVGASGAFIDSPVTAGMRYFFDRSMRAAMTDELRAQVEQHLELVGYLNHIDGHLNFHVHPLFADILVDLAVEYKVPCIRLPRERVMTTIRLRRDNAPRKLVESIIFRTLSRRTRRMMAERGLTSTDALFGLHQSGHLSEDYVVGVIDRIRDGTTELYFHPAADIGGIPPAAEAQLEVEILTSARVRDAIARNGIELITFADLAKGKIA